MYSYFYLNLHSLYVIIFAIQNDLVKKQNVTFTVSKECLIFMLYRCKKSCLPLTNETHRYK